MAAWPLLLLGAILLPFHLLFLASHLQTLKPNNNDKRRRWILSLGSIPLLLLLSSSSLSSTIFAVSDLDSSSSSSKNAKLISEVENLKLKIAKFEYVLGENTNTLNSKTLHLEENSKLVEEMERRIHFLQNSLSKLKASMSTSSDSETTVATLEEEVRLLWAESRKNNFDFHILESKANDQESKLEEITSEVLKMESIVTEQWIQIRQLEQSLQMMKLMASNVRKKGASKVQKEKASEFPMLKFIKRVGHHYFPDGVDVPDSFFLGNSISKSCISQAFSQLRRFWSAVTRWHYELQDSVKWALEMNEFTAPVANEEVVFFMASVIVVVPIMSAWFLLSQHFSLLD